MIQCFTVANGLIKYTLATDPPQNPVISGYEEGREVKAGNLLRLTCIAVGGNPLATLTWQKNGVDLEGDYGTSGQLATNELPLILEQTDNKANYSCAASNQATPTPLVTQVSLDVLCKYTWVQLWGERSRD